MMNVNSGYFDENRISGVDRKRWDRERRLNTVKILVICIVGILINLGGSALTRLLDLPIYLDAVGTVLGAGLCGYLPGIIIGLATNLINGAFDTSVFYYAIVNVFFAVVTYLFVRHGLIRKLWGILALILIFAVVGGGHEVMLNWFTNRSAIQSEGLLRSFWASFWPELIDKPITLSILLLAMNLLPRGAREWLHVEGWQQKILSDEEQKAIRKGKNRRCSLRTKILLLLVSVFIAVGVSAMVISVLLYRKYCVDEHIVLAEGTAGLVAATVDPESVEEFMEKGDSDPKYRDTERRLYNIRNNARDVAYVYVYQIREDGCHVVFDLDTDDGMGNEAGDVIEFDEGFSDVLPSLLAGDAIDPIITDDKYGWLITSYIPVVNSAGKTVAYAAADISMELIKKQQMSFLFKLLSLFLGFFILALAEGIWISEYNIILPVNAMSSSASEFAFENEDALDENVDRIRKLDIHTGDEIENMYQAFMKTTENNAQYVSQLHTKTETISQMQNALIIVLADMVESRDESTGDHVRKTAAYTRIIMDSLKELGYYTDQLTDRFIYDVEHSAPLHDIGKIAVSDVILNKPGKLTDEEFEIMKTHTTAGAELLDQVINTVPDSGYLKEARNLAEYHHEKWNGRGYPHGLAGEDIPLSARIMAVADVFDALVSERCYKKAFSFEKAMSIIQEDAGTHFDPKVAEAFKHAEDQVREVAEHFSRYKAKRGGDSLIREIKSGTGGKDE